MTIKIITFTNRGILIMKKMRLYKAITRTKRAENIIGIIIAFFTIITSLDVA